MYTLLTPPMTCRFGWAYDVTIADLRHALRTIRDFRGQWYSRLYASLWLLLISWSYQQRINNRSPVYYSFLRSFNPFGCFAPSLVRLAQDFKGETILIWGEADSLVPYHLTHKWRTLLPDAKLHTIRAASHNLPLEDPSGFADMLLSLVIPRE